MRTPLEEVDASEDCFALDTARFGVSIAVILVDCGGNGTAPISSVPGVAGGALPTQGTRDLSALLASAPNTAESKYKIYVANYTGCTLTTYTSAGKQTSPTIGVDYPSGVAVGKNGKIYVTNEDFGGHGFLSTYNPDGTQAPPLIKNLGFPSGVAVDENGKIYIANGIGVSTYNQSGTSTAPTITIKSGASGVAVDASGKIYIANSNGNNITTYTADGKATKPTITKGVAFPLGVAVGKNGKIYVANRFGSNVTTYTADGRQTAPTITAGIDNPTGLAADANGKILVLNFGPPPYYGPYSMTSYKANGQQTTPTITAGLNVPLGVAIH
jgi:hypothetical protein